MAAAIIVAVFALGYIGGRVTAPDGNQSAIPNDQEQLIAPPDERAEAGAVKAATSIARFMAGPNGDTNEYLEAAEDIAAPGWKDRARELAQGAADFISDRYGAGATVSFNPVRYRVRSHTSEKAVVDIWGVVLASGPKVGGIEESWITASLELVWVESEWKLSDQSSKGGPTPELLRTDQEVSLEEVLDGFTEYER